MIVLIWLLNFVISIFNAWGCGKTWNETKHVGGFPHFMNWMGAIMSACGFTWCYTILLGFGASTIPLVENAEKVKVPLLTPDQFVGMLSLGYLIIILPILGSGLVITLQMWRQFWERRTLANGAVSAYDTFAMIYNIHGAIRGIPEATKNVSSLFKGDDNKGKLVLLLVIVAAFGGILTTYTIITKVARATAQDRAFRYEFLRS